MPLKKKRKISFYDFETIQKEDKEDIRPASILKDVILYIDKLEHLERKHDCSNSKFCYLEYIEKVEVTENNGHGAITYPIFKLYFVSAKHSYSTPLVDRTTIKKRKNPKALSEGEEQKTHLAIKFLPDDVLVCLERNGNGISIDQVLDYFKKFTKKHYKDEIGQETDFFLSYKILAKENFLEEIKSLSRVVTAKVHVDKSILGSAALGYSDRTTQAQHEVIVEVRAERNRSIESAALDFYGAYMGPGTKIRKIRIEGRNNSNHTVIIDTRFIERVEHFNAELNSLTGAVESTQMLSNLYALAKII